VPTGLRRDLKVQTIILDKTGTVTKGKPELTDVQIAGMGEAAALRLIGSAEKQSEHPFAEAIVAGIVAKGIQLAAADHFEGIPGYGIRAI